MEIKNEKIAYDGKYKVKLYDVHNPNKDTTFVRECFERGDSVAALVFDSDTQTFLFTKQFRIGSQSDLIEIVAGSMDQPNETPQEALFRELQEELGIEVVTDENGLRCHPLGAFYTSPGACSEKIHLFIIDKINRIGKGGGVEDETVELVEFTFQELLESVNNNIITDLKTIFAIHVFISTQQMQNV